MQSINDGALSSSNPASAARLPKARASQPRLARSFAEASAALNALHNRQIETAVDDPAFSRACLQARVAIGLTFFAGLKPGEARGLEWKDYEGRTLYVRRSVWGKHSTEPKTRSSIAREPVEARLKAVLDELHAAEGKSTAGPILRTSRNGAPLDLHNLAARVIRPVLTKAGVEWKGGFYANRRGLASTCVEIGLNPIAAQQLLRHSNLNTTLRHYVCLVTLEAENAIARLASCTNHATSLPVAAAKSLELG